MTIVMSDITQVMGEMNTKPVEYDRRDGTCCSDTTLVATVHKAQCNKVWSRATHAFNDRISRDALHGNGSPPPHYPRAILTLQSVRPSIPRHYLSVTS